MTLSRAGIPFGNKAANSASRLTARFARRAGAAAVDFLLFGRVLADDLPLTPCARLRCAPSDAARVNVLPHSGQVKAEGFEEAAVARAADDFFVLLLRVTLLARVLAIRITSAV